MHRKVNMHIYVVLKHYTTTSIFKGIFKLQIKSVEIYWLSNGKLFLD